MTIRTKILPVILSGGYGTRLWPLSRESFPKQYLNLIHNSNKSLLQQTVERINNLENIDNPMILCNEEHRFIVAEQMRKIKVKPKSILLEPFGKNTAPAVAIASIKATEYGDDPILIILPSDHLIKDNNLFLDSLREGIEFASKGRLVTFGIIPSSPETGFGYIKAVDPLFEGSIKSSSIDKFIEKPNKKLALEFIKDKRFLWNSGIFVFKASLIKKEITKFSPELMKLCRKAIDDKSFDMDFQRINKNEFKKCIKISIDHAVMEKTTLGTVLPLKTEWSDLGGWEAIWRNSKKDKNKNYLTDNVVIEDVQNCFLKSDNRLLVAVGIKDLVVVDTNDATLIIDINQTHKIKNIVENLNKNNISEGKTHTKVYRPWGHFISIEEGINWKVKTIEVNPHQKLSLQLHKYRAEHWIVVEGTAEIEIDDKLITLCKNQSTFIPLGSKHRLSNPTDQQLIIIEVQSGTYLGEDDIIRFKDEYNRFN